MSLVDELVARQRLFAGSQDGLNYMIAAMLANDQLIANGEMCEKWLITNFLLNFDYSGG